jgi:hypothetical protein
MDPAIQEAIRTMLAHRRVRRIEVSPSYAELMAGRIDSRGYARSLMRSKRRPFRRRRRSPLAVAAAEAARELESELPPPPAGLPHTSPEYRRFLDEEISSWDYAAAVARYAKLEGIYRSPTADLRFPRPSFAERSLESLRTSFSLGGAFMLAIALLAIVATLGESAISSRAHGPWAMSAVGGVPLAVTVLAAAASLLLGRKHSIQRWLESSSSPS